MKAIVFMPLISQKPLVSDIIEMLIEGFLVPSVRGNVNLLSEINIWTDEPLVNSSDEVCSEWLGVRG